MNHGLLERLLVWAQWGSEAEPLLKEVRKIVYSDVGWNSPYRIDNFECTEMGVQLSIGNRDLKTVQRFSVEFEQKQKFQLVA